MTLEEAIKALKKANKEYIYKHGRDDSCQFSERLIGWLNELHYLRIENKQYRQVLKDLDIKIKREA